MDERKEFIISTAGRYFCISYELFKSDRYYSDANLNNFLDSSKTKPMHVILNDSELEFREASHEQKGHNDSVGRVLIFFKTKPEPISSENYLNTILVLSVCDSYLQSFYHAIQDIYTPALLQGNVSDVQPSLATLFEKIEDELRSTLFHTSRVSTEINSIDDELLYWKTVKDSAHKNLNSDARKYLLNSMQYLSSQVKSFTSLSDSDTDDTLENIMNILDDIWKYDFRYPRNRMINLLTIIGSELVRSLQTKLQNTQNWYDPLISVETQLESGINLCEKWNQITKNLTSLYWPHYATNPWSAEGFIPHYSNGFMNRLKEVLKLRMIFTQLQVAFIDYNKDIDYSRLLKPFEGINHLLYNHYTEPKWVSGVEAFYDTLSAIETDLVEVFRRKFQAYGSNMTALIMELSRFDLLLQQPSVLNSLSTDRQNFLEQIQYNVSSTYPVTLVEGVDAVTAHLEVAQLISPISEARMNLNKLEIYTHFANDVLNDLRGYDELISDINELKSKLKEMEEKQFKSWNEKMLSALKANAFRFATTDPVVYFQTEKLLQVNFSDKLFDLINDTRKLTSYGFVVNQEIVDAASKAKQFLEQAKLLFQVASFHNTMSERIITSQSPMMLNSARELARLVQSEHTVTWENSREVNDYIKKMQAAVENLANENNRLVNYHSLVMRKVEGLALAPISDFIQQNDIWLRTMSEIRSVVEEVEEKFTDTLAWRRHIDLQICKVLDVKYRWYLYTIEDHLPQIQISLVYRNQRVEYSPSLCVIKKNYFRKIKDSIDKLLEIRGIGDEKIFPSIKDKNSKKLAGVTNCVDRLFSKLQDYCATWRTWVSISNVDIESFFKSHKSISSEDWNRNFRASKYFGQQIAKLPSSHMIGPFYVSLVPLKMSIEWLNRASWNSLKEMLKLSILEDVDVVNSFVSQVRAITNTQAQKAEEFINFRLEHKSLERELESVMVTASNLDNKNTLLRSWAREVVLSAVDASAALTQARSKLKNYDALLQQQIDVFRVKIYAQAKQLTTSVQLFFLKWNEAKPPDSLLQQHLTYAELKPIMASIQANNSEWEALSKEIEKTKSDFYALDLEPPSFGDFNESINSLLELTEQMGVLEEFHEGLEKLSQEVWILISSQAHQMTITYLEDWKFRLRTMQPSRLAFRILEDIDLIEEFLPHLEFLSGEVLTDKHWADILEILAIQKTKDKLLYADLIAKKELIKDHSETFKAIYTQAASEIGIIQALSELDAWEVEAKFSTYEHVNSRGEPLQLIKDVKGISNKIGDYQCLLQSIKSSSTLTTFSDRVSIWENRLNNLDSCIQDMIQVQRKWAYLEPIFGNWDLEGIKFERISKEWGSILTQLSDSNFRVSAMSRMPNIYNILQNLLQNLLQCQRALQTFLEGKRLQFPRFYFLNDDDLLEILGQSDKIHVIQNHLKKIFVGINSVEIEKHGSEDVITTVYSAHGEFVSLKKEIKITPKAEEWLTELAEEVKTTLKKLVLKCMSRPDPDNFPSQVLCLSERINFTKFCEEAIKTNGLFHYQSALQSQHAAYSKQLLDLNGNKMEKHGVLYLKLKDLLFDTIHHLNIVKHLIKTEVKSLEDWNWQKILRFYCDAQGSVKVKMVDAQFEYTYEYQGNIPKLVHTSLTDKCYLTLTQAASMGLGGNPYGPAGTGKTESVKALGALLGRQVLVFNCDEGLDADSLMRIMIGIIKSGAWGCFDEFNRLDETTLSLISLQISMIQHALRNNSKVVTLQDREIHLDSNSGIFITLNPAGKGYGGRQKLPENLKQLFRPVLMSKPDDTEITQVILHCEGFTKAEEIGKQIVTLFGQARSLLSHQQHYDFGLRAIKTVVGSCGNSLKQFLSANNCASTDDEYTIAVNAVRLNTRCKLTSSDAVRFDELIKDIFPKVAFIPSGREDVLSALRVAYETLNLVFDEKQCNKCIELLEQLEQRMGVVVVGPQCSGKTTLIMLLKQALESMGTTLRHDMFNPKSMPRHQLLGQIDLDTRQWSDGLLTHVAQSVYNESTDVQCWIHSDGDVDPEWIESLNSVLDDNHLLTLPSGWRIQFGDNVHFIFETHDLKFASPATISRMGIILLSEDDLDFNTCIERWLQYQPVESFTQAVVQGSLLPVMREIQLGGFFNKSLKSISGILLNVLPFLDKIASRTQLAVSLVKIMGSMIPANDARKIRLIKKIWSVVMNEDRNFGNYGLLRYDVPNDDIAYYPEQYIETNDGLILTPTMIPLKDLLYDYVVKARPFILIAPAGSGKNIILNHIFSEIVNIEVVSIDCSAYLKPHHILQRLNQVCTTVTRNSRRTILPKQSERVIVHLSDLDGVYEDKYGTRITVEFLKQAIERNGFYDEQFEWIGLENITFIFTVRFINSLPARFIDLLNIVHMKEVTIQEQKEVVKLWGRMKFHDIDLNLLYDGLTKLMDNIHRTANDGKGNNFGRYMFTLREMDKLMDNLALHDLSNKSSMVEAYICEARRILKDQIADTELRSTFEKYLDDSIRSVFGMEYVGLLYEDSYFIIPSSQNMLVRFDNINQNSSSLPKFIKLNEEDWKAEVRLATVQLGPFVADNILLVPDFLDLTSKIEFIIRQPAGSILFPSKPGSGKKTALQIVSLRTNATIYTLKVNAGYGISNFQNDLKMIVQMTGISGESVILLIEDFQIIEPEFLNMISCLLSHGEVFGLYSPEEYEALSSQLKSSMEIEGYEDTSISYLRKRVHRNVHLVLMYEYDNVSFLELFRSNPSLPKLCYTIYSNEFSSDTMFTIPEEILKRDKGHADMSESLDKIASFLATMHIEAKRFIEKTTPLSFFYAITTYMKFFNEKRSELLDRKRRLQVGVTKISEAQSLVDDLKSEANEQKLLLDERQAKGRLVLDQISETMTRANSRKNEMEKLKVDAVTKNSTLAARKAEIDKELESITPLVEAAQSAVGNIKPESLTEIRSLRVPPKIIRDILEAVLCLMGILDTSWSSMKSFLAGRGIRDEIRFFDARQITEESRSSVLKLLQANKESFDIKNARRASIAAAPLAAWVQANVKYSIVLEKIRPLNEELADLEKNLNEAGEQIVELETALSNVDDAVAELKEQLSSSTREAAEIEVRLANAQKTIYAAEGLVLKLNDEFLVWNKQLTELSTSMDTLPMSCAISAGFVTYLPSADITTRADVVESWTTSLDARQDVSMKEFLMTEREILHWQSEGLPGDEYSLQNAAILLNTMMPLLLLDPASTAAKFLVSHFQDAKVESISIKNVKFVNALELAVKFGKVLVALDADEIHPMLIPILRKEFVHQGPRRMVYVGNKLIDYDSNFRLFLTTRSLSMKQRTAIPGFIPIVNFSPTVEGLTQQLLSCTLRIEKPDLEKRRLELLQEEEQLKTKLCFLQEKVLKELADSQGDILQNQELLDSLKHTKESSDAIKKSLDEAVLIKTAMAKECMVYESFALLGTRIFFASASLSNINNMYHLSVGKFISLFEKSLSMQQRVTSMNEISQNLVIFIYHYISRSLFKDDRLTFALQLIHAVYAETFNPGEWELFIGKTHLSESVDTHIESVPEWLIRELQSTDEILQMKVHCPNLYGSLKLEDAKEWIKFLKQANPRLPDHCALTPFQYILVLKALRSDMLHNELTNYALQKLGLTTLSPDVLKLDTLLEESDASVPVLIITSPGTDPSDELRNLARSRNIKEWKELVLGPGLEDATIQTLREASKMGNWVLLKNLHLVIHWLPVLENEIQQLSPHSNEYFRLWMTTESHHNFSEVLLSASLKITYEAPPGIKNNLLRTYNEWKTQKLSETSSEGGRAMFILAWFHALIQERRSYIPQGWTSFYEFNDVDLNVATTILKKTIQQSMNNQQIQWPFIRGLYKYAVYGGRVNNVFDLRVLSSYLDFFFSHEVFKKNGRPIVSNVYLPESNSVEEHMKVISSLPNENDPEYFGLPPNVEAIRQRVVIRKLYEQFKELDKSKILQEVTMGELAKSINELRSHWNAVKERLSTNITKSKSSKVEQNSSISTFLSLEVEFALKLIDETSTLINTVHQTIEQGSFPKGGMLNFALAIHQQQVPEECSTIWSGPINPNAWMESAVSKAVAIQDLYNSTIDEILGGIDLSSIFHGTDFLMALKQDAARALNVEMDQLFLECSWRSTPQTFEEGSMLMVGLLLEGALIVDGSLEMTFPDSPSVSESPTLNVSWKPKLENFCDFVPIPLYSNETREEVIAELHVPCKNGDKTKWIKAGTAFYIRS